MEVRNPDSLVRLGMLALPLASLLALTGLYSEFKLGPGGILATGDNRAIVSTGYFLSVLFGDVLALTVLIFGVVTLYAYLAKGGQRTLAFGRDGVEPLRDSPDAFAPGSDGLRRPRPQPVVPGRQPGEHKDSRFEAAPNVR